MANTNKTAFAVSVTPKILMDATDGVNQAMDVINENVRRSLGGSGEVTSNSSDITIAGGWANGVNTPVTSGGSLLVVDANTDMLYIKNTGFLFGTTTAAVAADTVQVKLDASATADLSDDTIIICELAPGEAIMLPRPGSTHGYILASGSAAVDVETLIVAT